METRPIHRVVEKRKGQPVRAPAKVQRYRAGRIPDYVNPEDLASSSSDDESDLEQKPSAKDNSSSSSSEDEQSRQGGGIADCVDLSAILDSIHAHDADLESEQSDEATNELSGATIVVTEDLTDEKVNPMPEPIVKRLRLKSRCP